MLMCTFALVFIRRLKTTQAGRADSMMLKA